MMRGKRENFFSREKKFSLSPRAPLSLSRKAEKLFYLPSPTRVGNRAFFFYLRWRVFFTCASRLVTCAGARFFYSRFALGFLCLALLCKARFWWETFVETKVLPPSPLSKELWVLGHRLRNNALERSSSTNPTTNTTGAFTVSSTAYTAAPSTSPSSEQPSIHS